MSGVGRLRALWHRLVPRRGWRPDPGFLLACDRARAESWADRVDGGRIGRITRSTLGPTISPDATQEARFAAIAEATPGELRDVCEAILAETRRVFPNGGRS